MLTKVLFLQNSVCITFLNYLEMFMVILAWLFSEKTSRYCHSPGVVGGSCVVQKLGHFLIYLLLLKIFTWNSE